MKAKTEKIGKQLEQLKDSMERCLLEAAKQLEEMNTIGILHKFQILLVCSVVKVLGLDFLTGD
jgi:hypothetical protein